ncbi:hypothetical protein BTVI_152677 [Pitangus sulphuratus]|nr:hypothetical protein BTVI_152677 [Pitangus sulphuratus]
MRKLWSEGQEKNSAGLDHIVGAMNIFCNKFADNCRIQICKAGEEILPTLLYIWTHYRPKDSLKESIIELFRLQVHIHHPKGAKTQGRGAYDLKKWQSILHNLYDLLVNEINLISNRGKYSSGSRNIAVKENLIELMADICHQVFTEDTKVLEITQSFAVTQREPTEDTAPNKRRRIELGWGVIRDNVQISQKDFDVIPWLQITTQLISKYPMSLPSNELPPLLNVLHQLLPQQRRGERTRYVLKCLTEVALCQTQKTDLKSTHKLELQRTWAKIWTLTIRSVSFQQIEVESFGLLGAMIQGNLVVTDKELWKIFSGPACKPSSSSVCCLSLVMSAYSMPENLDTGMEHNISERNLDSTLREAIMKWLLSCNLEEEIEECAELPPVLCSEQHVQSKEENGFSDVEELYLQTTFDEMDIFTNFAVNVADKNVTGSRLAINQNLRETLENCLLAVSEKLLSNCAPKSKVLAAEHLVRCASLLVGVLGCYCYTGIFKEEDACKSELFQNAKSSANKILSNIFLRLLTSKFMNDLIDICKNLMTATGKPSVLGEVDLRNDPEESIMEVDNQVSDDLFDNHSVAEISDTHESGDMQTATVQTQTVSFRASDIRRRLLMLTDVSVFDGTKPLHLHMYLVLLKELPTEEHLLPAMDADMLLKPLPTVCSLYRRDQEVCKEILNSLLPVAVGLAQSDAHAEETASARGQFLTVVGAFWHLSQGGKCTASVRVALLNCMKALLEADPHCKWAILNVRNEDLPVNDAFPHFLADSHHQVRILAAKSIISLFQDVKQRDSRGMSRPLPLKLQQKAFENAYLRVQEGMRNLVLKKVSDIFGYKSIEEFMTSHLDYLVMEWLKINDSGYSLSAFPYVLLNYASLEEFYRSCYKVLVPHLVVRNQFEDVKSLADKIEKDWRQVLADCFPKLLVNILPYFAYQSHGMSEVVEQRDTASKVYDMLKDENCLGKQQIDNLFHNNLPEIVVELLMTLHEPPGTTVEEGAHLSKYVRELDPAPNPPHFPSYVIKATLDYISNCHKSKLKSIVAVLSKSPVLGLLKYLVIDNKDNENLYHAIKCLDPFPEHPAFKDLRATQQKIKYSKGPYSLLEFLVVSADDTEARLETLDDTNLWIPLGESHETWIKHLTSSILDSGGVKNEVLQLMKPLCEVKTDLCQTLLPYLIHDIVLHDSDESWRNLLSLHIQKFFTACCKFASSSRSTPNSDSGTVFDDSFWLDLNYLEVAIAAQSCAAHFTALLYAEIYADKLNRDKQQKRSSFKAAKSLTFEEESQKTTISTLNEKSKEETGLSLQALQNFGLCHTLSMYLKGLEHENTEWCTELQEMRYQAAWRNMQWGHISFVRDETERPGYHESLYDALQSLRDKEFSAFHDSLKDARSVTTQQLNDVYLKWQRQSQLLKDSDFHFQEPIMALRTVILEILLEKENDNTKRECIKDILTKHLVELSRLARTAKNTQLPERAMFQIKQHNPEGCGISEWQLEEAQVFWAKKEESLALNILKTMIKKLDADWFQVENDPHLKLMYTECLRLCGTWLAETCLENPTVIMQKYLEKAVEIAASHSGESSDELKKGKMKAFLSLARFSDNQYQRIENYMKSSEFENKQALLKKAKEEVGLIRECRVQTNRYTVKVQRELELDECAIQALTEDRKRFLCKAVENYISCLLSGEEHDMWIFRLCSLWLENPGVDRVNEMMKDRMEAASSIINIVRKKRAHMVRDIGALCDAYITLANVDATPWKSQRKQISIPADQPIIKLKDLDVVVPTMEIKVDPTGQYENLVTIRSFKREFLLAGGMNLPKIIDCVGSDGKERRQLVKGRDDLRQDAVMQQVFQMCNTLLQQNTETRKRKLNIRRYKRSGVLEWCSGTTPIGEFLVNVEQGAHRRYRPGDYSGYQCQKIMMDAQKKQPEEKYRIFLQVCENFQPVFRYFCMEKFLDPAVWFEKRLAYTRSVATSSIVGYILGLGDRHVQNILIDEQTAELVHIDLGVAFEQGKILPTPETVPFRLTRDIVDGMGITGVEGVFRRCCEKTMAVMRNSQEALLTIVEVLLYDPLFDWTMNPLKALYLQQRPEDEAEMSSTLSTDPQERKRKASSDDQSFNKVAERVLMRLQEKLKGVEEGTVLSVGGQVNLLIQQAMDPKNLSQLFPGWKPWV